MHKPLKYATLKSAVTLPGGVYAVGAPAVRERTLEPGTRIRVIGTSTDSALCTTRLNPNSNATFGSTFVVPVAELNLEAPNGND